MPLLTAGSALPAGAELHVSIDGMRNDKGMITLCLTRRAQQAFLTCGQDPARVTRSVAADEATRIELKDLAPGDYNETRDVFVVRLGGGDGDGDGMDDDWEVGWFNTLARDGSGDFDGDGASDLAEFRAGTNPADGASVLRVLTLQPTGIPSQVTLLWSASPGRRYRVQYLPQIGGAWNDVTGDLTATGTSASAVVAAPPGNDTGFYRVLLVE